MFIVQKTNHFDDWVSGLRDLKAKAKIFVQLKRIEAGNLGNCKFVGNGVNEIKINYGPGYRLYFARMKGIIILLLLGGDKSTQSRDISKAKQIWAGIEEQNAHQNLKS